VEPELRFHGSRQWKFDFAWPQHKIAVEVHGGVHKMLQADGTKESGRHTQGKGFTEDREKMNEAVILGWKVLEFTTEMCEDGVALLTLDRLATSLGIGKPL
jgi:very-short-patch-repair endonuclease